MPSSSEECTQCQMSRGDMHWVLSADTLILVLRTTFFTFFLSKHLLMMRFDERRCVCNVIRQRVIKTGSIPRDCVTETC